jgi:hypothetical protein
MKFAATTLCVASERVFVVGHIKCDPGFCNDLFGEKDIYLKNGFRLAKALNAYNSFR